MINKQIDCENIKKMNEFFGRNGEQQRLLDIALRNRLAVIGQQEGINSKLLGRDGQLQFKKRIGIEGKKVKHHKKNKTDINKDVIQQTPEPTSFEEKQHFFGKEEDKKKVQMIEHLDHIDEFREEKPSGVEPFKHQIDQATELAHNLSEGEEPNPLSSELSNPNDYSRDEYDSEGMLEDTETEMEVVIGEINSDYVVLIASDSFLISWPLDFLPVDVSKGQIFSILIKRNTHSEVLRENAIWTQQSQLFSQLSINQQQ